MYARSKVESRPLAFGLISIIASGCAAGISNHPHGRAAGEWNVMLPTTASYAQGLAFGRGGGTGPLQDVDALLLADADVPRVAADETRKKPPERKRRADQTVPASKVPATPRPAPAAPPASSSARTELAVADSAVVGRYEAREGQAQTQQAFRGGDAIIIGASTLLIVILIVLLVLLLL